MNIPKTWVILLALLLAAMAIAPFAGAAETCNEKGIPAGTEATLVNPGHSINLFEEFGLQKPSGSGIPFRTYDESKEVADRILAELNMKDGSQSVIGVYDTGNSQIMLISQKDSVLEAVSDGKTVKTYSLVPQKLGEKKESSQPVKLKTDSVTKEEYTVTSESFTSLYSITLQIPEDLPVFSQKGILTSYIVKKSRTDVFRSGVLDIAQLHTEGWFYVEYGSSITSIGDHSSYWVTSLPFWQACEYTTQRQGVGTTYAEFHTHLKFGAPYERHTMDMWVSCDAWLNANDGGFTNSWSSPNGDACS